MMNNIVYVLKLLLIVILVNSFPLAFLNNFITPLSPFVEMLYFLKKVLCIIVVILLPFSRKNAFIAVVGLLGGSLIYLLSVSFNSSCVPLIQDITFDYFCCLSLFGAVVTFPDSVDRLIHYLLISARIVFILIVYVITTQIGGELMGFIASNYMFLANSLMIPLAFIIYNALLQRNIIDVILSVFGFLLLLLGSRGAILSIVLLILILIVINNVYSNKKILFVLVFVTVSIGTYSIFSREVGIDLEGSRMFSFLSDSSYDFRDEDRLTIWSIVFQGAMRNVLTPLGLCADRIYLNEVYGTSSQPMYAHNFFVEMFADFGLVGLIFSIWLFVIVLRFILSRKYSRYSRSIISVFFCISLFQLLFSRTFMNEHNLFFLLALIYLLKSSKTQLCYEPKSLCNYSHI